MKDLRNISIASIIVSIVLAFIILLFNGFNFERFLTIEWWIISYLYGLVLGYINTIFFKFLNVKYKEKNKDVQRIVVGIVGSITLTLIGYAFCEFMASVVILQKETISEFMANQKFRDYLFPLFIMIIISLLSHTIYFYKALQEKKVTEQKIIAGTASAKFTALKNQLDPHFLFNSLNVLTSLIDENPKMAQKFTTSLSKVYRYVLEQKDKELVTVDEELKFAKTYMTLLKLRFEDSIIFDIPVQADNPEARVVPLSLQILLENTIKHNVVMPTKPLHIKIYEKEGFLLVENNLQPKEVIKQSSGVGLGNVRQRYELLTKREFSVYKTDVAFIAKLPILTKKISGFTMEIAKDAKRIKNLKYKRAKKRVKKMKEFYGSLIAYCIVIPVLVFINYKTTGFDLPWFIFPMAGWGLGLFFLYGEAFNRHLIFGKDWEKKKIRKYMGTSKRSHYE